MTKRFLCLFLTLTIATSVVAFSAEGVHYYGDTTYETSADEETPYLSLSQENETNQVCEEDLIDEDMPLDEEGTLLNEDVRDVEDDNDIEDADKNIEDDYNYEPAEKPDYPVNQEADFAGVSALSESIMPFTLSHSDIERRVFELTNIERVNEGLTPLAWNNDLATAARAYSQFLAVNNMTGHNADGTVRDRIERTGLAVPLHFTGWAENLAYGTDLPETIVALWMGSPGHRDNILHPLLTHLGVGFYELAGSDFRYYTTQKFVISSTLPTNILPPGSSEAGQNQPPQNQPPQPEEPQSPAPNPPSISRPSDPFRRPAVVHTQLEPIEEATTIDTTEVADVGLVAPAFTVPVWAEHIVTEGVPTQVKNIPVIIEDIPNGQFAIEIPGLPAGIYIPTHIIVYNGAFDMELLVTDLALEGTHTIYVTLLDDGGNEFITVITFTITIDMPIDALETNDLLDLDILLPEFMPSRPTHQNNFTDIDVSLSIQDGLMPFTDDQDRVMVPLRMIAEAIGANVNWSEPTRTIIISSNDLDITLQLDAPLSDDISMLSVLDGRTFVPVDYLSQMLGFDIQWDAVNQVINIS